MSEERPTLGSLFTFLFAEPYTEQCVTAYQTALKEAQEAEQQQEPPELKPEETIRLYGRACDVHNWSSAKEVN